jgi:hypothetical protein
MKDRKPNNAPSDKTSRPFRVRLPGFVAAEEAGLGDVVTRISYAAGMTPCGGCRQRAQRLNRWIVFTR